MGAAQGKQARSSTSTAKGGKHKHKAGGDGSSQDEPLAKRSPKASPTRQSDLPQALGHAPPPQTPPTDSQLSGQVQGHQIISGQGDAGDNTNTNNPFRPASYDKENIIHQDIPSKSPSKGRHPAEVRETILASVQSPAMMEQRELSPLTPLVIQDNSQPQATSTPGPSTLKTPPLSPDSGGPDSGTDQSDDEAFTPSDQQLHSALHSPTISFTSDTTGFGSLRNSRLHSDSIESRRSEPNFGRFYNTSYLGKPNGGMTRGGPGATEVGPKTRPGSNFHRPVNFSYSKGTPDFLKKKTGGMSALGQVKRVVKVRRASSPGDIRVQEAIRLSKYSGAKPRPEDELATIERDDWPCPAAPAAMLPEILRARRQSKGEREPAEEDEDEEEVQEDPHSVKAMEEISKIKDESGMGRVIYRQLEDLKAKPKQPLDPWKASRTPSAKVEPKYRTRFQSPMFASPSRFLDRPRYAWDDMDIRTYRSVSALANLPTPKPGYGPSYDVTPRAATLPLSGAFGARMDFRYYDFGEDDRHDGTLNTSASTLTGDNSSRRHDSSYSGYEGPNISLLKLQKSTWHTETEPMVYSYEQVKITNFDLPKDVDTNRLEIHLANEEFESLFNMNRENFYRMAEWKRNDIKRKIHLY